LEVDSRAPTILPVAGNYTKLMIEGYVRASTAYTLEGIVLGAYVSTVESDLKYYLNASTSGKPAINRASESGIRGDRERRTSALVSPYIHFPMAALADATSPGERSCSRGCGGAHAQRACGPMYLSSSPPPCTASLQPPNTLRYNARRTEPL
jgi:hypothetical protein